MKEVGDYATLKEPVQSLIQPIIFILSKTKWNVETGDLIDVVQEDPHVS